MCVAHGLKKNLNGRPGRPSEVLFRPGATHLQLRGEKICSRQTYHLLSGEVTNIA